MSTIQPPDLYLCFTLPCAQPGGANCTLQDLSHDATAAKGTRTPHAIGPIWGVRAAVGQPLSLQLAVQRSSGCAASCNGHAPSSVEFSVVCVNLASSEAAMAFSTSSQAQPGSAAIVSDPAALFVGASEDVHLDLGSDSQQEVIEHPLSVLFVQPGIYQLMVTGVRLRGDSGCGAGGDTNAGHGFANSNIVVDKLNVLCL